jgi:hypothetical protein
MPSSSRFRPWPWVILGLVLVIAQGLVFFGGRIFRWDAKPAESSSWQTYQICGMSLQSPLPLERQDMSSVVPANVRQVIQSMEMFTTREDGKGFCVAAARAVGTPEATLNLDGAAKGALAKMEAIKGTTEPVHTITSKTIGGLPARHISLAMKAYGVSRWAEGDLVIRGQTLYQVLVSFDFDERHPDAQRVLDSVLLLPEK